MQFVCFAPFEPKSDMVTRELNVRAGEVRGSECPGVCFFLFCVCELPHTKEARKCEFEGSVDVKIIKRIRGGSDRCQELLCDGQALASWTLKEASRALYQSVERWALKDRCGPAVVHVIGPKSRYVALNSIRFDLTLKFVYGAKGAGGDPPA